MGPPNKSAELEATGPAQGPEFVDFAPNAMKPPPTFPLVQDPIGYVYLISSIRFFKIGFTKDLEKTVHDLRTGLPCAVELHSWIESEIPSWVQRDLHRRFHRFRQHGEWFVFTTRGIPVVQRRIVLCTRAASCELKAFRKEIYEKEHPVLPVQNGAVAQPAAARRQSKWMREREYSGEGIRRHRLFVNEWS